MSGDTDLCGAPMSGGVTCTRKPHDDTAMHEYRGDTDRAGEAGLPWPPVQWRGVIEAWRAFTMRLADPSDPLNDSDAVLISDPEPAMSPQRIQRKRTKGWRMPEGAVYVGRPSRWGNPYRSFIEFDLFLTHALDESRSDPDWIAPLRGHDLACWCPLDQPCHADVLIVLAASPYRAALPSEAR